VVYVVDKTGNGTGLFRVLRFSPVSIIPFSTYITRQIKYRPVGGRSSGTQCYHIDMNNNNTSHMYVCMYVCMNISIKDHR
jgi:hypothetical protein